ncbi:histamine N-methyltransferase-like [Amphiura filiformis]|uniref:histamine N-methyltransferase-like n=1 Tax=Amphiura filiformis TaxID=82378 RepID=UPI003B21B415
MAAVNKLSVQCLLDDDTYFAKSYDVFMSSNRMPAGPDWLTEIIAEIEPRIMQSVKESTGRTLKALGIGSGSGETEDSFVSHFQPHFVKVHQCIVEPSKALITRHKTNVLQNELKGVTYEWREDRVEDFMTSQKEDEKYHFITAIHCLYYVHNLEEVLGFLFDKLKNNGIILMVLTSDVSGCLDSESDDASMLLDFLTHVKDFSKAPLASGMKEEVFATIREILANSSIDPQGNNVLMVQKKDHKN